MENDHRMHLHQFLQEEQEPFILQTRISDERLQLLGHSSSSLQIKNPKTIFRASRFPKNIYLFSSPETSPIANTLCAAKPRRHGACMFGSLFKRRIRFRKICKREVTGNDFRFVLGRDSCSGQRTPGFSSSQSAAPWRNVAQGPANNDVREGEEETKERCSPVSVLVSDFIDDDDARTKHLNVDDLDLEFACAFLEKAKDELLQKLCRFERQAKLDPIELERRMIEQERAAREKEKDVNIKVGVEQFSFCKADDVYHFVMKEITRSSSMKKLIRNIIDAQEKKHKHRGYQRTAMTKRAPGGLGSRKEAEYNSIEMMVEHELDVEFVGWKRNAQAVGETVVELEVGVFGLLVDELYQDLHELLRMK